MQGRPLLMRLEHVGASRISGPGTEYIQTIFSAHPDLHSRRYLVQ